MLVVVFVPVLVGAIIAPVLGVLAVALPAWW
jgi:hypothetical protein